MTKSINVKHKMRGRPATGKTPITGVRLADEIGEALDKFAEQEVDSPTRSEAIRRILRNWLSDNGFLQK
ncbi:ribbon-helix-helix protein, CopG family [Rhizobium leguminosarum]|uniref:ribbon-helix-helix protein, CopG family n=1 Tax=Rhizobium leguminosarum TaxID=384 RepID=UPI000E2A1A2E